MKVREYTEDDLPFITVIWNEAIEEGNSFLCTEAMSDDEAEEFFASRYTAAAEDENGNILGLYVLYPGSTGRCSHIATAEFAVLSHVRGLHVEEQLAEDCLAQAAKQGYRILQVYALPDSDAYELYQDLGFTDPGIIPGGFLNKDNVYEDLCVMYHLLDEED